MPHYHALQVRSILEAPLALVHAEAHVGFDDPASAVLTDLRIASSVVVPVEEPLEDARRLMQHAGVRMAFVFDAAGGVIGLVTAADLQGERALQAATRRGVEYGELSVADVMTAVADWAVVDAAALPRARVGDIVATFRATAQRYLIVVEPGAKGEPVIRGLFSANRVERALGHAIEEELRSNTFSALAQALA
ncbi:CBS domain-containing protein [Piscinibacter defluvii]|uniref:CBS domain-containing protein n=1 Tax=Piscinibacter defluvii TaxID=1796922 RepID=UPI000FDE0A12|nr:CBS domain-containing protein [Piscinibacter defluvii]